MLYLYTSFRFCTFTTFNIIKMQAQFICYKPIFVDLELRYKLTKVIRLLIKNNNISKPINPTQPETKHFKFYWVRGNCGFY